MEEFAEGYSKLFHSLNLDKEVQPIYQNIEDMLTRLDELENLLVNVKAENFLVEEQMKDTLSKVHQFEKLKQRIDKLEQFIDKVDANVNEFEKAMGKAENEIYGSDFNLKDVFLKPFLKKDKSTAVIFDAEETDPYIMSITVFKSDDYFKDSSTNDNL